MMIFVVLVAILIFNFFVKMEKKDEPKFIGLDVIFTVIFSSVVWFFFLKEKFSFLYSEKVVRALRYYDKRPDTFFVEVIVSLALFFFLISLIKLLILGCDLIIGGERKFNVGGGFVLFFTGNLIFCFLLLVGVLSLSEEQIFCRYFNVESWDSWEFEQAVRNGKLSTNVVVCLSRLVGSGGYFLFTGGMGVIFNSYTNIFFGLILCALMFRVFIRLMKFSLQDLWTFRD